MEIERSPAPVSTNLPLSELLVLTFARFVMNAGQRMIYPFISVISRGLGVPTETGRLLIGARSAAGFASPLFGPVSDRLGRRTMMLTGLFLFLMSLVLIPLFPVFRVAFIAFLLFGLAKAIYDPALQAYVGDRVPYSKRGRAIGITELAWSGSLMVGAPIIGWAIPRFGWSSPFLGLALLALIMFVAIRSTVRSDRVVNDIGSTRVEDAQPAWRLLWQHPAAMIGLVLSFLIHVANEAVFVTYGEWMEDTFGLQVQVLGLLTAVIAVAEMGGESFALVASDRMGKRRLVLIGASIAAFTYAVLPVLPKRLEPALGVLFVMFLAWEMSVVAAISLISELLPGARGTIMGANVAAISSGRVSGALLGSWLWEMGGFTLNGFIAFILNLVAIVLVIVIGRLRKL